MTYFRVDTQALDNSLSKLSKIKKSMDGIRQEMSGITSRLSWEVKGQQQLDKKLSQLQSDFDALKASITRAEDCLTKVRDEYIDAQNDAKKEVNNLPGNVLGTSLLSAAAAIGGAVISKMLGIAPDNCQYAGDPVNVTTGSFYINAKDLEMPDLSGYTRIERKYSSINKRSGLLGAGWTSIWTADCSRKEIRSQCCVPTDIPKALTRMAAPGVIQREEALPSPYPMTMKKHNGS